MIDDAQKKRAEDRIIQYYRLHSRWYWKQNDGRYQNVRFIIEVRSLRKILEGIFRIRKSLLFFNFF